MEKNDSVFMWIDKGPEELNENESNNPLPPPPIESAEFKRDFENKLLKVQSELIAFLSKKKAQPLPAVLRKLKPDL